jgi:fatty acid/phospholipid biosynthesis enzyme
VGCKQFQRDMWGAFDAAEAGVADSVVKTHGRWGSDTFLRYLRVRREQAEAHICQALSRLVYVPLIFSSGFVIIFGRSVYFV